MAEETEIVEHRGAFIPKTLDDEIKKLLAENRINCKDTSRMVTAVLRAAVEQSKAEK